MKFVDDFLNTTTMYRVVLYVLSGMFVGAFILSCFGLLPYGPIDLVASAVIILSVSTGVHQLFSRVFEAPANIESTYITAFILVFIITPPQAGVYTQYISLAVWASIWAVASKYMLAVRKRHIFNPAAFAVALTAMTMGESASWWVGTRYMLPLVVIGGFLVVRKIRRADAVWSFLGAALASSMIGLWFVRGTDVVTVFDKTVLDSALLFFACIMLTEPLTMPPTRWLRIVYGVLVGVLFSPVIHIGSVYATPEIALVVGNVFAYFVSPKEKLLLRLKEMKQLARDTYEFVFEGRAAMRFQAGQYMEWTLSHDLPDSRGIRRFLTIASSPTESDMKIGVKFYPEASSFKRALLRMNKGDVIVASHCAGDFVMPNDTHKKLVFIAGGIGVTPFRSMIQSMIDTHEVRPVRLVYSNKTVDDIAYRDVFERAKKECGLKTTYFVGEASESANSPDVKVGMVNETTIRETIPDYAECVFYVSGPHLMVSACEKALHDMGVHRRNIVTDYFPGFA